jgi:tRNA threonylcarbamoyladenosine biosynthesis protein TsaB
MIDDVLSGAGVDRRELTMVAVGRGPGPFTGLRVGLVTARTLALALGLDIHGVTSLDGLALQALDAGIAAEGKDFVVATDARRREVYWARYRAAETTNGLWPVVVTEPEVSRPHDVRLHGAPCAGRGTHLYPEVLTPSSVEAVAALRDPSAEAIARIAVADLAGGRQPRDPQPLYLRRPDAVVSSGAKSVLAGRPGPRTP